MGASKEAQGAGTRLAESNGCVLVASHLAITGCLCCDASVARVFV
jgi:hypothetical protein